MGSSPKVAWKSPPGPITDLQAQPLDPAGIQLAFTNAVRATSHQYRLDGGTATALNAAKQITDLDPDDYTVEVRGLNAHGAGPWSNSDPVTVPPAGDPPVVANQTLDFGRLTRAGAGGAAPVNTGGPITSASIDSGTNANHWQIATNGTLTPSAAGVSAGLSASYSLGCTLTNADGSDGATITINTEANTYSFASSTELAAITALGRHGQKHHGPGRGFIRHMDDHDSLGVGYRHPAIRLDSNAPLSLILAPPETVNADIRWRTKPRVPGENPCIFGTTVNGMPHDFDYSTSD